MRFKIAALIALTLVIVSCQKESSEAIQTIDSKAYEEKLNATDNPQLLDVRTPEEFAVEHLNNAKNVDWNGVNFVAETKKYDKSKPIFVYCKAGGRSAEAADKLKELGFKEIYNLEGGIMKWTGEKTTTSEAKQVGITTQEYDKLIHSSPKVMVDFYTEWCGPCKKMKPYILKMQEELKGTIKIERLDADANKSIVDAMKLDGLPVILIYENGKEVWRNVGFISEEDLKKHI